MLDVENHSDRFDSKGNTKVLYEPGATYIARIYTWGTLDPDSNISEIDPETHELQFTLGEISCVTSLCFSTGAVLLLTAATAVRA